MEESADRQAIIRIGESMMEARNRFDAVTMASFYAEDAEFSNVKGVLTKGRESLEQSLKSFYATPFVQKTRQIVEGTSVKFVHPQVASLDIRWRTEGAVNLAGQPRKGLINAILVKDSSGIWKVKVSHNIEIIEGDTSVIAK